MRRFADGFLAVAAALLVVGPLAHLATHAPDHSHLPGGGVVWHRAQSSAHAHPHSHDPHHGHGDHGHADHDRDSSDDAPGDLPSHGAGSLAHLGGAPVLAAPVLVPPRAVRVDRPRIAVTLPAPPRLWGRVVQRGWRARAPPMSSLPRLLS